MKRFSLRYALLTSKLDQLWFPAAIFLLFIFIALIQMDSPQLAYMAKAYLGGAVPLVGGILAAYALLEDPAIELRFSTPVCSLQTLFERLILIFIVQLIFATAYQLVFRVIGGDFSAYLSIWRLQLAWIIPTLSLMMLGCICSLLAANSTLGALMVGMVWLVELIARSWFAGNLGKYFLIFMGPLMPEHPDLIANHISLFVVCVAFFVVSVVLLRRQERFI